MPRIKCPACGRPFGIDAAPIGAPVQCPYCRTVRNIEAGMIAPEPSARGGPGYGAGAPGVPARPDDIPVATVAQAPVPPSAGGGARPAHVPPPLPPAFSSGSGGYRPAAKKRPPARPAKKGGDAKTLAVVTIVLLLAGVIGLGIMVFNSSTQTTPNLASLTPPVVPTSESKARATRVMEERLRSGGGAVPEEAPAEGAGKAPSRKVPSPLAARDNEPSAETNQELDISVGTTDLDRKEDSESNRLSIIGQVRNNGTRMVRSVPILCRFYDAEGKALTSANNNQVAKAVVEWLAPGESAKFMIEWARTPDAAIKKHTLELGKPVFAPGKYVALKTKSPQVTFTDSDTGAQGEITGSVHNSAGGVVSDVQILVQLCDGNDNILRTLIGTPTVGQKLSPMQNGPFKLPYNGSSAEPNFTNPAVNLGKLEVRAFGKVE